VCRTSIWNSGSPAGARSSEHDEAEEIADEVGKILRKRRWATRESPFDGFKSPPPVLARVGREPAN
jgi:hypothetical protein